MSVGSSPIEIELNKHSTVLVSAGNGSGKSSVMLDSITFALYGKAYRNINKPNLVNSINERQCLVEVWFKTNNVNYYIKRGIKPHVFEIYKNDVLLNQDSSIKDYQKILEQQILRMNYRTFTQVVIMGSGNYIPFMKLPAAQRREFIEDLLDIRIFSIMNNLLRDKTSAVKDVQKETEQEIKSVNDKIVMQKSFIYTLQEEKNKKIEDIQSKIETLNTEIRDNSTRIDELNLISSKLEEDTSKLNKLKMKQNELKMIEDKIKQNITKNSKDITFFSEVEICPTCKQNIDDTHRTHIVGKIENKVDELKNNMQMLSNKLAEISTELNFIEKKREEQSDLNENITDLNNSISVANKLILKYNKEITELIDNTSSIDTEKSKLNKLEKSKNKLDKKKTDLNVLRYYQDIVGVLLKDTGIKTKIIKQYIPIINKMINRYMQQLEFFVSFNLDENFNEVIKSRYRDEFTYDSFSEGEKQRIDLALLFTFREVARIKNSANVNLLLMDETLDQSLDGTGIDSFFNMLNDLKTSNVFVISHRDNIQDKFKSSIRLNKKNDFTIIED